MYSSGYSQVSKYSPPAQKKMAYRSKGKSCGYYMRIIFFFSSLIQSLIIVSLVLFLIYGKKQDSASTSRIQDLEESFTRLSIENVALREQRRNLTTLLNSTTTEKARNEWDLAQLRHVCNISLAFIHDMDMKLQSCNGELLFCKASQRVPGQCPSIIQDRCNCGVFTEHLQAKLQLENSNFTQTTQRMRMEMDQITKDRDNLHLEVIRLRRDKFTHEKEVEFLKQRCKDEFSLSLSGVSNVTKAFLEKIESLFPSHIAFQISCLKQREHLEQIRTNCTTLSKEVEDKFQTYLNNVGQQVSHIISENSGLSAENLRLSEDYRKCTQNRTGLIEQHKQDIRKMQDKHGKGVEQLLVDKMKLIGENEVLTKSAEYRMKAAEHLAEQLKQLNMSCMSRNGLAAFPRSPGHQTSSSGWGLFSGGGGSSSSASSSSGIGQTSKIGSSSSLGSFGSPFNKAASTGSGSSSSTLSSGSSSSAGSLFNKLGSTGTGSSSSSLSSGTSSSAGSLFNKLGSTGTGSSSSSLSSGTSSSAGSLFNKLGSTGTGSSSTSLLSSGSSSSTGSLFSKLGSAGTGSSSTSLSSSGSSSSTGSLFNKPGSTGGAFSSFGSAGSNPSLSSSVTGLNKPVQSGRGSSTTGLSSGSSGSSPSLSSSGIGLNKPTSSAKSSSGFGSSSGSTGSTNKSGSSSPGFSWLGFGNSNSGQSKTGSGTGKGTSSGSYGGTGSTFGGGRTSGLGGGSGVSVAQHLQELQRLINPASPEERQDLSRILG